nr:Zn-dependent hydrolase [Cytophagales bacterium]
MCDSLEEENPVHFVSNPALKTVAPGNSWKGTPMDSKGRFIDLYHPFEASLLDVLTWKLSKNPQKAEKKADERRLDVDFDERIFEGTEDYLIWLGHATFLMRINGKVLLTDPVLFDNIFLTRKSALPFPLESLPPIDYMLLSHNHRDHCDKKSLRFLSERNPSMVILTGLGIQDIIGSWMDGQLIQEAGWFQQYNQLGQSGITITYVPSRHWSKRWLNDDNKSLWGGFLITYGDRSIYFMGDSGAGNHFSDIKNALESPDLCLMGVGAFRPEWFMNQSHISPSDAILAFNELEGKSFFPMHFGTFDLSDEPMMEPWDILLQEEEKINGKLIVPIVGKNLL